MVRCTIERLKGTALGPMGKWWSPWLDANCRHFQDHETLGWFAKDVEALLLGLGRIGTVPHRQHLERALMAVSSRPSGLAPLTGDTDEIIDLVRNVLTQ